MTIAKDFASKAAIAFVAAAMIFSMFAPSAKAQSSEDLQAQINTLLAQIAALSGTTGSSATTASGYVWTRDLNVGATGADVKELQMFLNKNADTRVSASGVGSVGMETEYFGPATAAAVSKFQVMHRAEVLTPAGLVNPTGFFGPGTRAKANALCVATTGGSTTGGSTTGGSTTGGDDNSSDLSGEADFEEATLDSADDDELEEGSEDAPIAELTVNFVDGDASISRLDVKVNPTPSGTDPWDVLETVSLWVDGDMVKEMDASDKDSYQSDDMTLRFSGLDIVAMEDEDLDITIAATVQDGVDSGDQGALVTSIETMRYFDADGVADTIDDPATGDTASVTIGEAGQDDEITVKAASSDPDSTTLKVEDSKKSEWYTVFAFDLDTDESVNDIVLNEVPVTVVLSTSSWSSRVDDYELVIDGVTIDNLVGTASTSVNGFVTDLVFDVDGDVTIDAGDRVTAELRLRFKSIPTAQAIFEGMTVQGKVTAAQADAIDAEGADTLETTQLSGAATGDTHALRTKGVDVTPDSDSATVTQGDSANDDYATYKIVLEVTAFEQDVFINTDESVSVDTDVVNSSDSTVAGTSTVVVDSSADVEGGSFKINEGETETVTITVTFDATTAGAAARLKLNSLVFGETDGADNQTWLALPATDYRTDIVTLVN